MPVRRAEGVFGPWKRSCFERQYDTETDAIAAWCILLAHGLRCLGGLSPLRLTPEMGWQETGTLCALHRGLGLGKLGIVSQGEIP